MLRLELTYFWRWFKLEFRDCFLVGLFYFGTIVFGGMGLAGAVPPPEGLPLFVLGFLLFNALVLTPLLMLMCETNHSDEWWKWQDMRSARKRAKLA